MTDAHQPFGLLDDEQRIAVFLELGRLEEIGRKTSVSLVALGPYALGLTGVVAIDYSITFTVLHAAAVPGTPVLLTAIKSLMPLVAIGAFCFLDQKIAELSASTAAIQRGAGWFAVAVPFGLGAYLGWEIFLSAREVLADASLGGGIGGFGDILSEHRTTALTGALGQVFAGILGATVAGFFTVSSYVGHRCLTELLDIARTYGATKGKAQEARQLVTEMMQADHAWGDRQREKEALLHDGQPVRDAVMAVSEAGFGALRHAEKIVTAKMLSDPPKRERIVIKTGLPEDVAGWSLKGLKQRMTEVKAVFLPSNLFRVYRMFEDLKEIDDA